MDNGKENGNYYIIIGFTLGLYRDNEKKMETTIKGCGCCLGLGFTLWRLWGARKITRSCVATATRVSADY